MDKTPLSSETRLLLRLMNLTEMNSVEMEGTAKLLPDSPPFP
jgi:hypothetical protein